MRILITGAAGSIGAATLEVLKPDHEILGIDNFDAYYSPSYKRERIEFFNHTSLIKNLDICDYGKLKEVFIEFKPEVLIHLAARPGVRTNYLNLEKYIQPNIVGFNNVSLLSKEFKVLRVIFASSSSVYNSKNKIPFTETDDLHYPISFYAITKQSNELMAKYFASESTKFLGMRFFTVYGPWGRPDMAVLQFLGKAIKNIKPKFMSELTLKRDFTFVDDATRIISESIGIHLSNIFDVVNVGGGSPRSMSDLISTVRNLGLNIELDEYPFSNEDTKSTHASIIKLKDMGFTVPNTSLEEGVLKTYDWLSVQKSQTVFNSILELNS